MRSGIRLRGRLRSCWGRGGKICRAPSWSCLAVMFPVATFLKSFYSEGKLSRTFRMKSKCVVFGSKFITIPDTANEVQLSCPTHFLLEALARELDDVRC